MSFLSRAFFHLQRVDNMTLGVGQVLSTTAARTRDNLRRAGISASVFGLVVGVTPSTMRSALAGSAYLGSEAEARHLEVSARLLRLVEALHPLKCDHADVLRKMLEKDTEYIKTFVGMITQ